MLLHGVLLQWSANAPVLTELQHMWPIDAKASRTRVARVAADVRTLMIGKGWGAF